MPPGDKATTLCFWHVLPSGGNSGNAGAQLQKWLGSPPLTTPATKNPPQGGGCACSQDALRCCLPRLPHLPGTSLGGRWAWSSSLQGPWSHAAIWGMWSLQAPGTEAPPPQGVNWLTKRTHSVQVWPSPSQSHALCPRSQGRRRHDACFSECPKYMKVDTGTVMRWGTNCT